MKTTLLGGFHFGAELGIRGLSPEGKSPTYYCKTAWENKKALKPQGLQGFWCAVQDSNSEKRIFSNKLHQIM